METNSSTLLNDFDDDKQQSIGTPADGGRDDGSSDGQNGSKPDDGDMGQPGSDFDQDEW